MTEQDLAREAAADAAARTDAAGLMADNTGIDARALEVLFTRARSHNRWTTRPVEDATLRRVLEIAAFGPTSTNQQPMRVIFVRSEAGKQRLLPMLAPPNRPKVTAAPLVAILGYDLRFFEKLPALFPHRPEAADGFRANETAARISAFRNGTLQGAYFMMAARAVGLDIGALSGFDNAAVDAEFFAGTGICSNFLCCLGHGDAGGIFRRLPRLGFDDMASFA